MWPPRERLDIRGWAFQPWQRVQSKLGSSQQSCLNLRECQRLDSEHRGGDWCGLKTEGLHPSDVTSVSSQGLSHNTKRPSEMMTYVQICFDFGAKRNIVTFCIDPCVWTRSPASSAYICFGGTEGKRRAAVRLEL